MFINFIKLPRMIKQLTSKSLTSTDSIPVVSANGVPYQIPGSEFSATSLIFAHVSFDASAKSSFGGDAIASHNVKSITRTGEGVFVVEFNTAHATGAYTAIATAGKGNHTSSGRSVSIDEYTATSVTLRVERTDTGSQQDEGYVALVVLG